MCHCCRALARDLGRSIYALVSRPTSFFMIPQKSMRCSGVVHIRDKTDAVAKDLRNHGDSPHAQRHDYTAMAEDVGAFIEEHKIIEPTIIGHSM